MSESVCAMKKPAQNKIGAAFSLVELLVVIAVIAIIAAIAIPNIAGITGAANTSKDKRNAQNIASVFNSAVAAGYTNAIADVAAAIAAVTATNGVTVAGATFRVDGLSAADKTGATAYLTFQSPTLIYSQTASTP